MTQAPAKLTKGFVLRAKHQMSHLKKKSRLAATGCVATTLITPGPKFRIVDFLKMGSYTTQYLYKTVSIVSLYSIHFFL